MNTIKTFDIECSIAESTKLIRNMFNNSLTKRQMDLIYAIISLINPTDAEFEEYVISYEAIGKIFNPENPRTKIVLKDIEKATKGIMAKNFQMETDDEIIYYHYVEKAIINKSNKSIKFKLNDEVKQFYIQLKKGEYTNYLLKDLLALSTTFQANLFRWLSCNAGFSNDVLIQIEDAAKCFYGKEIKSGELIRKIDSALKVINERTNINATYEKQKQGQSGKIVALKFTIENCYIKPQKTRTNTKINKNQKQNLKMWQENEELKKRLFQLECENDALTEEVERLNNPEQNKIYEENMKIHKEKLLNNMKKNK